ncbi:hypothetical protein OIE82_27030 [Streptomyces althioticus]|uniref:Uncharacterized protein n=1 Tax=Streptomyces althioticus TaxID=83380 RepID=A0ABZ1YE49_9ACTN
MSTSITYLIRVDETTYIESFPSEVAFLLSLGLTLDIRIVEASK